MLFTLQKLKFIHAHEYPFRYYFNMYQTADLKSSSAHKGYKRDETSIKHHQYAILTKHMFLFFYLSFCGVSH